MRETLTTIAAHQHAVVTARTFGHLVPKPRTTYNGWILFTLTAFGDTCIIDFEFKDLDSSPWFNSDILDYIGEHTNKIKKDYAVIKWNGHYKKFKNGNFKFKGEFKEIDC